MSETVRRAYARLDLRPGVSHATLRRSYLRKARQWHPDHFVQDPAGQAEATRQMQAINDAYHVVLDSLGSGEETERGLSSGVAWTPGAAKDSSDPGGWAVDWRNPWNVLASALLSGWLFSSFWAQSSVTSGLSAPPVQVTILAVVLLPKIWWGSRAWRIGGTLFLVFMTAVPFLMVLLK